MDNTCDNGVSGASNDEVGVNTAGDDGGEVDEFDDDVVVCADDDDDVDGVWWFRVLCCRVGEEFAETYTDAPDSNEIDRVFSVRLKQ